ncbi:hypothetical protein CDAR_307851 [Caerostris darwini]|uniref:Maturase K n=1 Tax=Caerostris darwini TaxID=1538125 RepID=A0AAV4SBD1_9ARAC|nr:hypothetical protein CDAR_307851 [Caerostris darwini]
MVCLFEASLRQGRLNSRFFSAGILRPIQMGNPFEEELFSRRSSMLQYSAACKITFSSLKYVWKRKGSQLQPDQRLEGADCFLFSFLKPLAKYTFNTIYLSPLHKQSAKKSLSLDSDI